MKLKVFFMPLVLLLCMSYTPHTYFYKWDYYDALDKICIGEVEGIFKLNDLLDEETRKSLRGNDSIFYLAVIREHVTIKGAPDKFFYIELGYALRDKGKLIKKWQDATKYNTQSMISLQVSQNYLFCLEKCSTESDDASEKDATQTGHSEYVDITFKESSFVMGKQFKSFLYEPLRGNRSVYKLDTVENEADIKLLVGDKKVELSKFLERIKTERPQKEK